MSIARRVSGLRTALPVAIGSVRIGATMTMIVSDVVSVTSITGAHAIVIRTMIDLLIIPTVTLLLGRLRARQAKQGQVRHSRVPNPTLSDLAFSRRRAIV